jgi:hypothetical protein
MADANVPLRFPAQTAAADVGGIIDSLLVFLLNIETAEGELGRVRERTVAERIDALATASKAAVSPADALRAKNDLDTLRKTYDDQEAALNFWDHEVGDRLDRLANDYGDQVLEALERRLAQLRQKEAVEQGDVDAVKTVISEIESRRQHIQSLINKRSQKKGGAAPKTE